ncbi:hypothetical protein BDZ91DRAFT_653199 [Kalaharituber pfeilii]|nr:hypothetical protein BDZ91DRAFT_653199 [Kalaharituber pfeilii]
MASRLIVLRFTQSIRALSRPFSGLRPSHCNYFSFPCPRPFSSAPRYSNTNDQSLKFSPSNTPSQTLNSEWLSTIKARIGKCIFHGLKHDETLEVAALLKNLATNWREYVAGSDGFLTTEQRRGLFRHSVVWEDMVAHDNNVTNAFWTELVHIPWALNYALHIDPEHAEDWKMLWTPKDVGLIISSIKVDYKIPLQRPDKVSVYHKLNSVGKDSFALHVIILSEKTQRPAARCLEDIVIYDYNAASKVPLPDWMRKQFDLTLQLQKEAMQDALEAVQEVERQVDDLEHRVLGREEMK